MKLHKLIQLLIVPVLFISACGSLDPEDNVLADGECEFEVTGTASLEEGTNFSDASNGDLVFKNLAQSIQISTQVKVSSVQVSLSKVGSPSGSLTLTVEKDSGGAPDGAAISTGTVAVSSITNDFTTSKKFVQFNFDKIAVLDGTKNLFGVKDPTTYWLRLSASYAVSAADYITWRATGDNTISNGQALYQQDNGLWSDAAIGSNVDFIARFNCK